MPSIMPILGTRPNAIMMSTIVAGHDPNIMQRRQSPTVITIRAVDGLEDPFTEDKPCAIATSYHEIPVAHAEAELRGWFSPFPEEASRKMTGQIAALHLASMSTSNASLRAKGVDPDQLPSGVTPFSMCA